MALMPSLHCHPDRYAEIRKYLQNVTFTNEPSADEVRFYASVRIIENRFVPLTTIVDGKEVDILGWWMHEGQPSTALKPAFIAKDSL